MKHTPGEFSIWAYVGVMLLIYGVLLIAGGAYQIWHPPATVLARYHATLCAGVVLTIAGMAFVYGSRRDEARENQNVDSGNRYRG